MEEKTEEIFEGFSTVDAFIKEGYKALMDATRCSNSLPSGGDWNFYSTHDSFNKYVNARSEKLQSLMNLILRKQEIGGNIRHRTVQEKTELLVEGNDVLLERVANNIDEMNGIKKINEPVILRTTTATLPINGSWNRAQNASLTVSSLKSENSKTNSGGVEWRLLTAKNITPPQTFFEDKIDNSNETPWEPRIKDKPNSKRPLAIFLEEVDDRHEFCHPYEYELDRFTPTKNQLKKEEPVLPKPIAETPLVEIDKPEQLLGLVGVLRNHTEIAVDLEHHSYRSFMGITCLMQISTKDKDYLIDTLALRNYVHVLNEVFTKPHIVKIFHGAECDILWLQRDLSLYIVNMFDTHQAAKQLGFPRLSLAYLLQKYCGFSPNKHFQLADWRIRPLPDELKSYARDDTHYLIHIYRQLKNELLEQGNGNDNFLKAVLQKGTDICKARYFKPILREDSYLDFYRRCKRLFDNRQLYALKELYKWRDQISREEDESTGYVLPNHMLLQISEALPREMQGILACCNPIPPLVRSNLLELHKIVLRAREQPLERAIMKEDTRDRGITKKISKINVDSPLHCPHDLSKSQEFRDDLPTLINNNTLVFNPNQKSCLERESSIYSVFNEDENSNKVQNRRRIIDKLTFLGPYERYKLVKPFIQDEEHKLATQLEEQKKSDGAETTKDKTNTEEDRTVEESIESVRQHFLKLSREFAEKEAAQRAAEESIPSDASLIQLGGSKKRKRDYVPEDKETLSSNSLEISFQTPAPSWKSSWKPNDNRKRKSDEFDCSSPGKKAKRNQKRNKNKQKQNAHPQETNTQNDDQNQSSSTQMQNKKKPNKKFKNRQHPNANNPTNSQNNQSTANQRNNKRNNKNFNKNQSQKEFVPYDYSSVDFRQFQGGAGDVQRPKQVKSNFKPKIKRKGAHKGQNKSFTFGKNKL